MFKIINIVLAFGMFSFTALQLNDPDPILWVLIYSVTGIALLFSAFGKRNIFAMTGLVIILVVWMIYLSPGFFYWLNNKPAEELLCGMSPDRMYVEESREFLGLFIAILTLIPSITKLSGRILSKSKL